MRINKYIAESGFCSRRKADEFIQAGKVIINGKKANLGDDVDASDKITINGTPITTEGKQDIYIAFNKPIGVISTLDEEADNSVLDYIDLNERVFYIGRLDVASHGLMLLTNNGDVADKIARSKNDHEKEYVVRINKPMTRSFIDAMRNGIEIEGQLTKPAKAKKLKDTVFQLIITEGRNRQIRKMCEALGYQVKDLRRTRVMNVRLRDLGAGNWRYLSKKERRELLDAV
jgi:23S rRNA pseudouridine2604 synthase